MKNPPAFQFYPSDWITATMHLTAEEKGIYISLLCACWEKDGLLDDTNRLQKWASVPPRRLPVVRRLLGEFFSLSDGVWRHKRLDKERAKQQKFSDAQRLKGKASGEARRKAKDTTNEPGFNRGLTGVEPRAGSHSVRTQSNSSISNLQSTSTTPTSSPSPEIDKDMVASTTSDNHAFQQAVKKPPKVKPPDRAHAAKAYQIEVLEKHGIDTNGHRGTLYLIGEQVPDKHINQALASFQDRYHNHERPKNGFQYYLGTVSAMCQEHHIPTTINWKWLERQESEETP